MTKESKCHFCGMVTSHPAEYHPWVACKLFQAGVPAKTIKANIDAVLDHGRALERQGLPNDALISQLKHD